jgi:hypothetical protein
MDLAPTSNPNNRKHLIKIFINIRIRARASYRDIANKGEVSN